MKVLMISARDFEDLELFVPFYRLKEEGIEVDIASLTKGSFRGKHGYEVNADFSINDIDPDNYEILVLPGGKAPALLRTDAKVLNVAAEFMDEGKPVAAICHGPQILAAAGVIKGRKLTCYPEVEKDITEAGANYRDAEVIVDGNLITSRKPADLPAFNRELIKMIKL